MAKRKKVKSGIIKWLLGSGEKGTKRKAQMRKDFENKKGPPTKNKKGPPPSGSKPKPPPKNKKNQQKPPPKKPNVRQRKDGRWAVVGSPNKTYANKGAATRAFNQQQKAATAAKRKENIGKGIGAGAVITLGTLAATSKKDDKNKGQGPTRKRAEALKSATNVKKPAVKSTTPASKKRTAAELELIPKGARPPAVKKTVVKKPATKKRTAAELELIPKGAKPAVKKTVVKKPAAKSAARKTASKKLKPFEQGVRFVDTPFGKIKMDTTDEGMAMEFFDSKYGGQVKGKVKRRMGGIVKKGYGKAQRGY